MVKIKPKAIMAKASKFITDETWETNWELYADIFDVEDIASDTHRLYLSQAFSNPDYPNNVHSFFKNILQEEGEDKAIKFVRCVIKEEFDLEDQEIVTKDPQLLMSLGLIDDDKKIILQTMEEELINIQKLPHDFYYELQEQINKSYKYRVLPAVQILLRKMLENLLIDILREKYMMKNVEMFYNTDKGRFHSFSLLCEKLEENLDDFKGTASGLDKDLINSLHDFREKGNSSAHSLEVDLDRDTIKEEGEDAEYIIKVLTRVLKSI